MTGTPRRTFFVRCQPRKKSSCRLSSSIRGPYFSGKKISHRWQKINGEDKEHGAVTRAPHKWPDGEAFGAKTYPLSSSSIGGLIFPEGISHRLQRINGRIRAWRGDPRPAQWTQGEGASEHCINARSDDGHTEANFFCAVSAAQKIILSFILFYPWPVFLREKNQPPMAEDKRRG